MLVLSIIFFAAAILLLAFGVVICKGNTKLIHDYHRKNVRESERKEYAKAFAKGLFTLCAALLLSGIIALFDKKWALPALLIVLATGFAVSNIVLIRAQKKYNGGIFS